MLERLASIHPVLPTMAGLLVLVAAALTADLVVKRGLLEAARRFIRRNQVTWDEELLHHNVFGRLSQVVPAIVILLGIDLVPAVGDVFTAVVKNVTVAYLVLMVGLTLSAALSAVNDIYEQRANVGARPLRGFIQLLQLVVFIIVAILIVSVLIDQSPLLLLSGFGAMTAVLLLVFKDTILGFVASVQISANDMVRVGDWVELPTYGANGDVLEVGLHTVKVQNFDRTITTIPTYKLISDSFKNWRGMSDSGGRRIKRALALDQTSIRFLRDDEVEGLKRFRVLRPYLERKSEELAHHMASLDDADDPVNQRRLTNVGTFRAYVRAYLESHPDVDPEATLLVRQLPPGPHGLPVEIYCFARTTEWRRYEDIQSDIFDHVIAIAPEFGLRPFQQPSGVDVRTAFAAKGG